MFIYDKLCQLHPLFIIVLVGCIITYIAILHKISTEPFRVSIKYSTCCIVATISMFSVLYALINTDDIDLFQNIIIPTYILLRIIMDILK
jgi:hypothetical protein